MTNIIIAVISAFIMQFEIVKKFYNWLIKLTSRIGLKQITLITLIVIMSYSLVFFNTYNESDFATILMTNTVLIILYTFITFKMIKAQDSYLSVKSKYVTALGSLKEYEKMLDQYRIMNHENKNQLLTVRSMIVKKEEKITNYIDNIINEKINDDEKLMFETSIIPEGGLRAVVYSKILHMKNNQINFYLNIDRKVRSYDLVDLDDNLVLDICKIISVYLDNAIDEVKDIKDGSVSIKFYVEDNKLCISISNTFDFVELDFIDNRGYTTKSEGHGYGLPLAKKIIDNSKNLYNYREINDNIFTQILKIKV
ncbi:MAG: GHKL domain-containing protein [Bacilli bacterium]|nr:GHKL domain-containing protein [Bacilli bacterium]MDD4808894.1 GHKL domain-containing protein [Bacilli bacterium]